MEQRKIEQQKGTAEQAAKTKASEVEQKQAAAEATQTETFRKECKASREKNIKDYMDFLNTCTRYSAIEFCDASDTGKLHTRLFAPRLDDSCINTKLERG